MELFAWRSRRRLLAWFTTTIAAFAMGIGVGLTGNWLWAYYERPDVQLQMAMAFQEWTQVIEGDSAHLYATVFDAHTQDLAVRLKGTAPRTLVAPYTGEAEILVKMILRNSGRTAATDLRIPLYVSRPGSAWIEFSPHINAELSTNPDHKLGFRVDAVHISALPPKTPAVITYHLEIDSVSVASLDQHPIDIRVRPPIGNEIPPLAIDVETIPMGMAAEQENRIGMVGVPVLVQRFRPSGNGGPLVSCVDSADVWYRQIVTLCGGRGPEDP